MSKIEELNKAVEDIAYAITQSDDESVVMYNDIQLINTCSGQPEQYNAVYRGAQVGYLRLRWGYFNTEYPDCDGVTVYGCEVEGDGEFIDSEREEHLRAATAAIKAKLIEDKLWV